MKSGNSWHTGSGQETGVTKNNHGSGDSASGNHTELEAEVGGEEPLPDPPPCMPAGEPPENCPNMEKQRDGKPKAQETSGGILLETDF